MRIVLLLFLLACTTSATPAVPDAAEEDRETFIVASKLFLESAILAEAAEQAVATRGHATEHKINMAGSGVLLEALRTGQIDAYPEYTGTLLQDLLKERELTTMAELRQSLADEGLGITEPLGFNNTYAMGMNRERADALGIATISDLADHPDLRFRLSHEYLDRGDGWPALRAAYELPHEDVAGIDHDLAYLALVDGQTDVTDLYSTDAEIAHYGLAVLEDDRAFFTRYDAVFLYRLDLADRLPGAVEALQSFEGRIDEATILAANDAAKFGGESVPAVAARLVSDVTAVDTSGTAAAEEETRGERIGRYTREHLLLVGVSMLAATLIAIPLGVVSVKNPTAGRFILPAVGVIQTIPSLALLAFMLPILPRFGLPGLGATPAIIALTVYALLPMVRNTQQGLASIPRSISESADALALSPWTKLRRIELPLAMPAILAGVKTSAVITVGFATLGAFIAAGGYGEPILNGLRSNDTARILEGAVPAAVLALLVQFGLDLLSRLVVPRGLR